MSSDSERYRYQMLGDLEPGLQIYVLDSQYRYQYFNKQHKAAMKEAFGVDIEIGEVKIDYLSEPLKSTYESHYVRTLEGDQFNYVLKFEEVFIQFQFFPFEIDGGKREILVKARDISEDIKVNLELEKYRKQLEDVIDQRTKELQDQRNFFQTVIDEDPNMIFVRDKKGVYIFANQALADSLHKPVEEIQGNSMFELHAAESFVDKYHEEDLRVIESGEPMRFINQFTDARGKSLWLSINKKKVLFNNQYYVLGVMSDITDLVKAQSDLEATNQSLNQTLHDLKEMQLKLVTSEKIASILLLTSGFMHEINNPINYVSGNVDPLRRDIDDLHDWLQKSDFFEKYPEERENYDLTRDEINILLDGIEEGTDRVKELVKNLRNLSSSNEEEKSMCHVHEIIDTILTMLNLVLEKRNINVKRDYGSGIEHFYCNPNHLNQIFINILDYMISRMEEEEELIIITSLVDEMVQIELIDERRGITEKEILRMVDPFDKISPDAKMGLAVSYRIASKIGGTIDVLATSDKTHFYIKIPTTVS